MIGKIFRLRTDEKAFTLIEVIVSLVLFGIMAVVIGMGIVKITEGYILTKQHGETAQKAQIALARIVKELGAATSITPPAAALTGSLTYERPSGVTNTIALSGSTVQITLPIGGSTATSTLIDNVDAFTMDCRDSQLNQATTNIRQIIITLTTGEATFMNRITTTLTASEPY